MCEKVEYKIGLFQSVVALLTSLIVAIGVGFAMVVIIHLILEMIQYLHEHRFELFF